MLPENWQKLPSSVLFLDYMRPAYRVGQIGLIKEISDELSQRLDKRGYVKVPGFGRIYVDDLNLGLEMGAIEQVGEMFVPVAIEGKRGVMQKIKGRQTEVIQDALDASQYEKWWNIVVEKEKKRGKKEYAVRKQLENYDQ